MTGTDEAWITGVGAASPLGHEFATISDNLLAGRSGVGLVSGFPVADHPSRVAGVVGEVPCPEGWSPAEFATRRPVEQVALWTCAEALRDAGLPPGRRDGLRVGLILGLGAEWIITWEYDSHAAGAIDRRPEPREPLAEIVRRDLGLQGPSLVLSAACASGNHALAQARRWLAMGWADVCLAGACDLSVTPISLACFGNLRTLSRRNDDPPAASRPFDRDRDGFVIGEGGAMFVVEPASTARKRGAKVYASIRGFGATSDAHHPIIPSPDPEPAASAIRRAVADAGTLPDYINAHAPGTPVGDLLEAHALRAALGDAARSIPISSTKSMTGHLLAAAGAFEALVALTALDRQALPPTINLDTPDPACADLNHVAREARPAKVDVVMSNSIGFGGSNSCLMLRKV